MTQTATTPTTTTRSTFTPPSWVPYVKFTIDGTSTAYDTRVNWDMVLVSGTIGDPEVRKHEVTVPGRDGALDMSDALGGVYFENRQIEMQLACVNWTLERFFLLASTIRNAIEGRKCRITFSDDLGYFWLGRPTVDVSWNGPYSAIVVRADVSPYKYSTTSSYDPWVWDSFSFVNGVVTDESDITLTGSTESVTLPKDPARGKPTLWLNSGSARARLSTDPNWYVLKNGANLFPEIRQSADGAVTLLLNGTGSVGVEYRIGSL